MKFSCLILCFVISLASGTNAGGPAFLMEPFDEKKFEVGHKWWVDSYTDVIYGDADRCAHFTVTKVEGQDNHRIATEFINPSGDLIKMQFVVKDDPAHPARFFLEADGNVIIEIGVVATDYDNWAIVWSSTLGKSAYHVTTTKPQNQAPFQAQIDAVLTKLGLKAADLRKVKNEDCSNKDTL